MVITITMKNVYPRGNTYHYRLTVPADCREAIGQSAITQSLKTSDELDAAAAARKLDKKWKKRFKEVRQLDEPAEQTPRRKTDNAVAKFKRQLSDFVESNLSDYLDANPREKLIECCRFCTEAMIEAERCGNTTFELEHLLGVSYPPPAQKSPGRNRKMKKAYVAILAEIREAIDDELGEKVSEQVDKKMFEPIPQVNTASSKGETKAMPAQSDGQTDLMFVAKQMIDTKNIDGFFEELLITEITNLIEWCGGKRDLTAYTKADVVNYVRNCLPYIPKNRTRGNTYAGKTLRQCVKMTKANPGKYVPISHRTCENRFAGMGMVFNYAKEYLGIVPINLAKGIEIPQVRKLEDKPKAFTEAEIIKMWAELKEVKRTDGKHPERYWAPILGLYHGARLNELCSLQLQDIYEHDDGTFVMDINERGSKKSVKNKSSIRIVPVHPYVLDNLGFNAFIKKRKTKGKDSDLLFPNLTYSKEQGYGRKMSRWFNLWKKEWLKEGGRHKNFHGLRYSFIQQGVSINTVPLRIPIGI